MDFEWYSEKERSNIEKHGIDLEKTVQKTGLSPERVKRIREAQKRHACFDPGCERWTPEEFINWHPINGMTWEERARRMRAAGIVDPEAEAEEAMYREEQVM